MFLKTICLAALPGVPEPAAALEEQAQRALRELPGVRLAQVNRVVRHIPTDYIANDKPYGGVAAAADEIAAVLDLHFDDAAAAAAALASPGWNALLERIRAVALPLFMLDSEPNVPVPLRGRSLEGGFRRWLLLTRKPATRAAFREAWFVRHANLVKHLPLLDGYVQNLVTQGYDGNGKPLPYESLPIDGIAEVCYASQAAMDESYGSDARLPLRDDGRDLNARVSTVLVEGRVFR